MLSVVVGTSNLCLITIPFYMQLEIADVNIYDYKEMGLVVVKDTLYSVRFPGKDFLEKFTDFQNFSIKIYYPENGGDIHKLSFHARCTHLDSNWWIPCYVFLVKRPSGLRTCTEWLVYLQRRIKRFLCVRQTDRKIALFMGLHTRLGRDAALQCLGADHVQLIFS